MLWYLGDGSVVQDNNRIALRLSTDGFAQEGVEFLVSKLEAIGISCHRNGDNRIYVEAKGIPKFFEFIGTKSPVKCYDYKFEVPEWRLESKRMSEVAEMLNVDYSRLAHLVKIGKIPTYRASIKGKPRFLAEHIKCCKQAIKAGELY